MPEPLSYIRDGAEIYRRSFAMIRAEADLAPFAGVAERVAVRVIHACGMVEIARDLVMSADFADKARQRADTLFPAVISSARSAANRCNVSTE